MRGEEAISEDKTMNKEDEKIKCIKELIEDLVNIKVNRYKSQLKQKIENLDLNKIQAKLHYYSSDEQRQIKRFIKEELELE